MKTGHHPSHKVDSRRDPGAADGLTRTFLNNDHINLSVIDLNDLKWLGDVQLSGRSLPRIYKLHLTPPRGTRPIINK